VYRCTTAANLATERTEISWFNEVYELQKLF
jgi:hypothetical protein